MRLTTNKLSKGRRRSLYIAAAVCLAVVGLAFVVLASQKNADKSGGGLLDSVKQTITPKQTLPLSSLKDAKFVIYDKENKGYSEVNNWTVRKDEDLGCMITSRSFIEYSVVYYDSVKEYVEQSVRPINEIYARYGPGISYEEAEAVTKDRELIKSDKYKSLMIPFEVTETDDIIIQSATDASKQYSIPAAIMQDAKKRLVDVTGMVQLAKGMIVKLSYSCSSPQLGALGDDPQTPLEEVNGIPANAINEPRGKLKEIRVLEYSETLPGVPNEWWKSPAAN